MDIEELKQRLGEIDDPDERAGLAEMIDDIEKGRYHHFAIIANSKGDGAGRNPEHPERITPPPEL